jgi:hypothetical protein
LLRGAQCRHLSGILQMVRRDERIVIVGRTDDRYKKKIWGVNNGDKKLCGTDGTEGDRGIGYDGLGEKSRKQEPAQRDEETPLADVSG